MLPTYKKNSCISGTLDVLAAGMSLSYRQGFETRKEGLQKLYSVSHALIWVWLPGEFYDQVWLTHWSRVTHICVSKLSIIASDNGLSPGRRQAIIITNAGILLIWPLGTNFSEILIKMNTFSFKKMRLKMSSAKWRPFCLGLNVLSGKLYTRFSMLYNMDRIMCYSKNLWDPIPVWYYYNAVSFLENPHKRHPIAHPLGRGMGCLLWVHTLIYVMARNCSEWN